MKLGEFGKEYEQEGNKIWNEMVNIVSSIETGQKESVKTKIVCYKYCVSRPL